jgi:hypothetical protein
MHQQRCNTVIDSHRTDDVVPIFNTIIIEFPPIVGPVGSNTGFLTWTKLVVCKKKKIGASGFALKRYTKAP